MSAPAPAVAVVTPAPAATTVMGASTFSAADRDFAMNAALSNMMEIGASQMAPRHTSSPDVLDLAARINRDHTMAMNDLMALMRSRGMAVPGDIAPHQRNLMDKLGTDWGYEYDRDFVTRVGIQAHENDIAAFQQTMPRLSDPALRDWAARTLPHIDHEILHWSGDKPQSRILEEARTARYALLAEAMKRAKAEHLFVAHHQDDQAADQPGPALADRPLLQQFVEAASDVGGRLGSWQRVSLSPRSGHIQSS